MDNNQKQEIYLKTAQRAFYRNPFSDLLILSSSMVNRDELWKGLHLPLLLIAPDGSIPAATKREIIRRKRANLYVWGNLSSETLAALSQLTKGQVFQVMAYEKQSIQSELPVSAENSCNQPQDHGNPAHSDEAIAPGQENQNTHSTLDALSSDCLLYTSRCV